MNSISLSINYTSNFGYPCNLAGVLLEIDQEHLVINHNGNEIREINVNKIEKISVAKPKKVKRKREKLLIKLDFDDLN